MLSIKTDRQCALIINNILKARKDINQLNKTGYNFIYLCSGFIAHYDLYGFRDYYKTASLKADILRFRFENQYNNFNIVDAHYNYYMQKKSIYNAIVKGILEQGN